MRLRASAQSGNVVISPRSGDLLERSSISMDIDDGGEVLRLVFIGISNDLPVHMEMRSVSEFTVCETFVDPRYR